jgi:hypothetical protein
MIDESGRALVGRNYNKDTYFARIFHHTIGKRYRTKIAALKAVVKELKQYEQWKLQKKQEHELCLEEFKELVGVHDENAV